VICGESVDLWDVGLLHKNDREYSHSDLYFADLVKHPVNSHNFPTLPLLDIGHNRNLFRRVIACWLAEPLAKRIGRGAFAAILQDKGTLRFSHLRELVTIIEMQVSSAGKTPLSKSQSRALRTALKAVLEQFATKEPNSAKWHDTMQKRIDNINYHDAKLQLSNFILRLPKGFVSLSETFTKDVIELRNTLVHDISRIKSDDQRKLAFFVAKLKALYALSDAIALGATPDEVREDSRFFTAAKYMPANPFTGDTSDSSDD
jgi:hypothetical protein